MPGKQTNKRTKKQQQNKQTKQERKVKWNQVELHDKEGIQGQK